MNIDGVKNGIVLDHITAGRAMEIYRHLDLDDLDCCVAIIKNVESKKKGKKDILKVDAEIDIDLDMLGFLDPNITVNIIKNEQRIEKKQLALPQLLRNVITCSNPRCITGVEQEIDHIFELSDPEAGVYRCSYCETAYEGRNG
ncbi:MAG: aspartate carbamoyltransferase regulatory subunit [Ruminococcaceae bacterium]|nr:aspartate carbamoyltransferase regulatory subunit [Oscillospiraceae bacterium]